MSAKGPRNFGLKWASVVPMVRHHINDNDNESNFIVMNYIYRIIGNVQASSWIKKWTSIRVHTSPLWYSQYTFFTHINVWHEKQNHNALFTPNNAVSKFMAKGARSLGLWAPIFVDMKQNIERGAEEQWKMCKCNIRFVLLVLSKYQHICYWQYYAHCVLDP